MPSLKAASHDSFDVYEGRGHALTGDGAANLLDVSNMVLVDVPAIRGGAGDDRLSTGQAGVVATQATTYDGGDGTNDHVTINLSLDSLLKLSADEISRISEYVANPSDTALDLLDTVLNMTLSGFESATIAIFDDGESYALPTYWQVELTGAVRIITGTAGDDVLEGTDATEIFIGLGGNDVIRGFGGDDLILGGAGDDIIYGGGDANYVYAGSGNDTVYGLGADDLLHGGSGDDLIFGGDGYDQLVGGAGNDRLSGGRDIDDLSGGQGDDSLFGDEEHDVLNGGAGVDLLDGGEGDDDFQTRGDEALFDTMLGGEGLNRLTNVGAVGQPLIFHVFSGLSGPDASQISFIFANDAQIHGTQRNDDLNFGGMWLYNVAAIQGLDGDDTIRGSQMADVLFGNAGADLIYGGEADDYIFGGTGDDRLMGETGADHIESCTGDDTILGGVDNDMLLGQGGNDLIDGQDGDDKIDGGSGADSLYGGLGADWFQTQGNESEADLILGQEGDNRIVNLAPGTPLTLGRFDGAASRVFAIYAYGSTLQGTDGDNYLNFGSTALYNVPSIQGRSGNDTIYGSQATDQIFGGDGADELYGLGGNDSLIGDAGDDLLNGGTGLDTLFGREGNDWLYGDADNDSLYGERGADLLFGGDGSDLLNGGEGDDVTDGGLGSDNHELKGTEATGDRIVDSSGTGDRITNNGGATPVVFRNFDGPNSGIEFIYANNTEIIGTNESNVIDLRMTKTSYITLYNVTAIRGLGGDDTIFGGRGYNVIYGGDGNDTIYGADLNDTLYGDAGNDTIYGLAGSDTIVGGIGIDTVYGGTGTDYFRFDRTDNDADETDVIADWSADFIMLYGYQSPDISTSFASSTLSIEPSAKKITLTGVTTRPSSSYIRVFA